MSNPNNNNNNSTKPSALTSPTPSQLYAAHTSTHPNPPHLSGMGQRFGTTLAPNAGTMSNTGGGGMSSFAKSFSWFSSGGGNGGNKL